MKVKKNKFKSCEHEIVRLDWDLTLRALVLENYTVLQQYLVSKPIKTDWRQTREEKNVMFDD